MAKEPKVVRTEEEWRQVLNPLQYEIMRNKKTERAGTGEHTDSKAVGTYLCLGCDNPLFSSRTKFETKTGYPSFYSPIGEGAITIAEDKKHLLMAAKNEVLCAHCDSHLGQAFDDGPAPTFTRYSVNSAALKFVPK